MVGGLWFAQDRMIFPSHMVSPPDYPLPDDTERLELETDDGAKIVGNLVLARNGESQGLIIGFPGNAWQADDFTVFLSVRILDYDIAVFHYRGYQPSTGRPSQKALFSDALLIHDTLQSKIRPARTVTVGTSIGSGVAAFVAKQRQLDGIVLVTPFDSIAEIAKERFPWAPVRSLIRHPFPSAKYLDGLDIPSAVIIAGEDELVSEERSRALVDKLTNPVFEITVPGQTHAGIYHSEAIDHLLPKAVAALDG